MNDPETLGFYTAMQVFRNDPQNHGMILKFPSTLSAEQCETVRSLAIRLNLDQLSFSNPPEGYITIIRLPTPLNTYDAQDPLPVISLTTF